MNTRSCLDTNRNDFGEFDLHVEFWTKSQGNSGISIRDASRGRYGAASPPDFKRTPSKISYEIQIKTRYPTPHPTGSIYGFMDAKPGSMLETPATRPTPKPNPSAPTARPVLGHHVSQHSDPRIPAKMKEVRQEGPCPPVTTTRTGYRANAAYRSPSPSRPAS